MRKLRLGAVAFLVAVVATLLPASPADAARWLGLCTFTGTANTGPLWLPGANGTGPWTVGWSFSSSLDVCLQVLPNTGGGVGAGNVSGNGTLTGACGFSLGSGTATIGGQSVGVTFVTVGGTGVLVGVGGTNSVAAASFQARPLPSGVGQVPCVTEPATNFLIVGVAVGLFL